MLASFGDSVVRLSTANTYSYRKGEQPHHPACLHLAGGPRRVLTSPFPAVDLPFQEYVEHLLHPQDPTSLGNGEADLVGHGAGGGHWKCSDAQIPASPVFSAGRYSVFLWGQQFQRMGVTLPALFPTPI